MNIFRKLQTKFYQNHPSFVENITRNILVFCFPETLWSRISSQQTCQSAAEGGEQYCCLMLTGINTFSARANLAYVVITITNVTTATIVNRIVVSCRWANCLDLLSSSAPSNSHSSLSHPSSLSQAPRRSSRRTSNSGRATSYFISCSQRTQRESSVVGHPSCMFCVRVCGIKLSIHLGTHLHITSLSPHSTGYCKRIHSLHCCYCLTDQYQVCLHACA